MKVYFSPTVKQIMIKRSMTGKELASLMSVSPEHLSRMMQGKLPIGAGSRKKLTVIFRGVAWERIFRIAE